MAPRHDEHMAPRQGHDVQEREDVSGREHEVGLYDDDDDDDDADDPGRKEDGRIGGYEAAMAQKGQDGDGDGDGVVGRGEEGG